MSKRGVKLENDPGKDQVISDFDMYQLSKYYPGQYRSQSCYVPSGEMGASVPIHNGFSITQGTEFTDKTAVNLGSTNYTVLLFCPILSHLTVSIATTDSPVAGKQVSGLMVGVASESSATLQLDNFFGINTTSTTTTGTGLVSNLAMENVYGFQSDASVESFIYSSKLTAKFVIPRANLTGTLFSGKMRLSQFFSGSPSENSLTIDSLIRGANKVEGMQTGFSLHSAMVNDYILTHTARVGDDIVTTGLADNDLGSEIIDYVVLQQPSVSISGGTNAYSLIWEMSSNAIVMPTMDNLLLYRTFSSISHGKQSKEIDYPYSPLQEGFLDSTPPPVTQGELEKFEKEAEMQLVDNSGDGSSVSAQQAAVGVEFCSRKAGAIERFIRLHQEALEDAGLKVPLQLPIAAMGRAALAAFSLGKNFIDSDVGRAMIARAKNAYSAARSDKKGVSKSLLAGLSSAVTGSSYRKLKKKNKTGVFYDILSQAGTILRNIPQGQQYLTKYADILSELNNLSKTFTGSERASTNKAISRFKKSFKPQRKKKQENMIENSNNPVVEILEQEPQEQD